MKSSKEKKSSRSMKIKKNVRQDDENVLPQPKVCNLKTLVSDEKTKEIGLFYSQLAEQEVDSSPAGNTSYKYSAKNDFDEVDRKLNSSELDKKLKTKLKPNDTKRYQLLKLNRKSRSNASEKRSKLARLCKELNLPNEPLISNLVQSLREMEVSETQSPAKTTSEREICSNQPKSQTLFYGDVNHDLDSYFNLFKQNETSSPKESSDSGTLTPGSDDSEYTSSTLHQMLVEKLNSKAEDLPAKGHLSKIPVKAKLSKIKSENSNAEISDDPKTEIPEISNAELSDSIKIENLNANIPKNSFIFEPLAKSQLRELSQLVKLSETSPEAKLPELSVKSKIVKSYETSNLANSIVDLEMRSFIPKSNTSKFLVSPVSSNSIDFSVKPKENEKSVISKATEQSVTPTVTESSLIPKITDPSVRSKLSDPSVRSRLSDPSVRSEVTNLSVQPEVTDPLMRPNLIDLSVRRKVIDRSVRRKITDSSERSKLTDSPVRLKLSDSSVRPKLTDQSVRSKVTDPSVRRKIAEPSVRPKVLYSSEKQEKLE